MSAENKKSQLCISINPSNSMEKRPEDLTVIAALKLMCEASELSKTEIADLCGAVDEALMNANNFAYKNERYSAPIRVEIYVYPKSVTVSVIDTGSGIEDVEKCRQPFYTSEPSDDRHSGMGFTIMETYADNCKILSDKRSGTTVILTKKVKEVK